MFRFRIFFAAGLFLIAILNLVAQEKSAISLPADPAAIIITWDWTGVDILGTRKNMNPALTIRANGAVTVTDPKGIVGNIESSLTPAEVQDLLHFIVAEQDFFAIDISEIWRAILTEEQRRVGVRSYIADASDTVVHIKTADREHDLRFNALSFSARKYPSIKELRQFLAVETKLRG